MHGLGRSGRLLTSTALVLAVVMVALATSGIVLLKLIGCGPALAVIVDATATTRGSRWPPSGRIGAGAGRRG
ncbi:hypothetical protein [Planobispora takensis]|uniref:Uncharacterized protein n=1 Tax=Planobispora takensis TaxID=1367882 RepID=A0A8J3T4T9_9ACTN|nr:hypothetical protein [Planobispora takensis]GII04095.1 hypothetical protein Pta02_61030 [Planobispora takensis]